VCEGFAVEDGAALHFEGARLARVISSRPGARAYRMTCVDGGVERLPLAADYLGSTVESVTEVAAMA
jgi:hypothetical protein